MTFRKTCTVFTGLIVSIILQACGNPQNQSAVNIADKSKPSINNLACGETGTASELASCLWEVGKKDGKFENTRAQSDEECGSKWSKNKVMIAPEGEPSKLFCSVDQKIFEKKTFATLIRLFGHYTADTKNPDSFTDKTQEEISAFLDAVIETPVMGNLQKWLLKNQMITQHESDNFKETLYDIWFTPVRDGTSSGFEHVFVGEVKTYNKTVGGYHSWVKYYLDELTSCPRGECTPLVAQYVSDNAHSQKRLGRILENRSNPNRVVMESTWELDGEVFKKKVGGFFLGTTPETEFALGTLAFFHGNFKFLLDGREEELRVFYQEENDRKYLRTVF